MLPKNYVDEAIYPQTVMPMWYLPEEESDGIFAANYGNGWIITSDQGHYRVEHGGSIDGFRSTVAIFSNYKIGVVVLTNQVNYEAALIIRNIIVDKLFGLNEFKWLDDYQKKKESLKNTSSNSIAPETENAINKLLYDISGKYRSHGYGVMEIFKEGKFYYTIFRNRKLRIVHKKKDIFHAVRVDSPGRRGMPPLHFNMGENGTIMILKIQFEPELGPIQFVKQ